MNSSAATTLAGYTTLIVAVSGVLVALVGAFFTRLANRDANQQQNRANALAVRVEEHELYRDLVAELRTEVERVRLARGADRVECEARLDRLRAALVERGIDPERL